jgi:DNA-directed RNA polymerase specialized sigma24 family protein
MKRSNAGPGGSKRTGTEQVNAALVRLLIADALAQLPAEHRAVICRSYYLGWTTAQIAEDLQIAECTVNSRLHSALRTLRLALQDSPAAVHSTPGASNVCETVRCRPCRCWLIWHAT